MSLSFYWVDKYYDWEPGGFCCGVSWGKMWLLMADTLGKAGMISDHLLEKLERLFPSLAWSCVADIAVSLQENGIGHMARLGTSTAPAISFWNESEGFYNTFKQKGAVVYFNVQHFKSARWFSYNFLMTEPAASWCSLSKLTAHFFFQCQIVLNSRVFCKYRA